MDMKKKKVKFAGQVLDSDKKPISSVGSGMDEVCMFKGELKKEYKNKGKYLKKIL